MMNPQEPKQRLCCMHQPLSLQQAHVALTYYTADNCHGQKQVDSNLERPCHDLEALKCTSM